MISNRADLVNLKNGIADDGIYEMAVATATGGQYIYGFPILSHNEKNLQYGLQKDDPDYFYVLISHNKKLNYFLNI